MKTAVGNPNQLHWEQRSLGLLINPRCAFVRFRFLPQKWDHGPRRPVPGRSMAQIFCYLFGRPGPVTVWINQCHSSAPKRLAHGQNAVEIEMAEPFHLSTPTQFRFKRRIVEWKNSRVGCPRNSSGSGKGV